MGCLFNATNSNSSFGCENTSHNFVPALGFTCTLIACTVIFNTFTCAITLQSHDLRTVTNYFMVNLYVSDVLVAVVSMPVWAMLQVHWNRLKDRVGYTTMEAWQFADILCGTASICSLVCVTIDRRIAISRPLRYVELMTHKRMAVCILITWLYALLVASCRFYWPVSYRAGALEIVIVEAIEVLFLLTAKLLPFFRVRGATIKGYSFLILAASFVLPLAIILFTYYHIFVVARAQILNLPLPAAGHKHEQHRRLLRELKTVKTIAFVIGTFVISWLPFFIVSVLFSYTRLDLKYSHVKWMPYCNALFNPLVYTFCDKHIKAEVARRLVQCGGRLSFFQGTV